MPAGLMAAVPRFWVPAVKVTVPVGGRGPVAWTTEMRISCWPAERAVEDGVKVVAEGRRVTVWRRGWAVAGEFSLSPE